MCSVRIIISMAVNLDWPLHQLDVSNAFLYGDLAEEVYIEQAPSYVGIGDHSKVCRLHQEIYGLKQSPRAWFTKFSELIRCQGFSACKVEPTVFRRSTTSRCVMLAVYVDDMLITGNDLAGIESTKKFLHAHLDIRDLGTPKYFLGIKFAIRGSMSLTFCKTWGFSGASLIPRPSRVVPTSGTPPLLYSRIRKSIDAWSGSLFISRSLVQTLPIW